MTDINRFRSVETPSGKGEAHENFPVSPLVLPGRTRPHVTRFYAFARVIDDIADNPSLTTREKIDRLSGFEAVLGGDKPDDPSYRTGHVMRDSLKETGISARHCLDLISAFKQDAVKNRYDTWDELIDYCNRSAAPVGRYLIDLHGGSKNGYGPSDALCNALQVINHLQDCREDFLEMDRVYLPMNWMDSEGARPDDLARAACKPELRAVLDFCLDGAERLLGDAASLTRGLNSFGLKLMSAAIVDIAGTLVEKLRGEDPIVGRVALSKPKYFWCCVRGSLRHDLAM